MKWLSIAKKWTKKQRKKNWKWPIKKATHQHVNTFANKAIHFQSCLRCHQLHCKRKVGSLHFWHQSTNELWNWCQCQWVFLNYSLELRLHWYLLRLDLKSNRHQIIYIWKTWEQKVPLTLSCMGWLRRLLLYVWPLQSKTTFVLGEKYFQIHSRSGVFITPFLDSTVLYYKFYESGVTAMLPGHEVSAYDNLTTGHLV